MAFKTALIVDDSKLARVTLKKKLEARHLVVHAVDSAEQAYGCLASLHPDIIFMDHLMPETDGFEATQHIRQMEGFQLTPIVMCTGKDHDGYLDEALSIGANFILSKPPVDEALTAILDTGKEEVEETYQAEETDVADFLSGHDEQIRHAVPVPEDKSPALETDVSDFMEEPVEALEESPAAVTTEVPSDVQQVSAADIERICRQVIAAERAGIISNVLAAIPAPVVSHIESVSADRVAEICEDIIANERNAIIHDVLASVPAPEIPDMSGRGEAAVDMESILSTVNATVTHQLAVNTSSIKNAVFEQILQDMESLITEKISESMDRDIQSIIDLRLNVMIAEQMGTTHNKLEILEQQVNEKLQVLNNASDLFSLDSPMKLTQRNDVSDRVSDLYEKFIALESKLKVFRAVSLVASVIAIVAVALAFF